MKYIGSFQRCWDNRALEYKRSSICRVNTAVVTVGDLQRVYVHPAEPRDHVQIEKLCLQAGMVVGDLRVKTTPLVARPYREQCSMVS